MQLIQVTSLEVSDVGEYMQSPPQLRHVVHVGSASGPQTSTSFEQSDPAFLSHGSLAAS